MQFVEDLLVRAFAYANAEQDGSRPRRRFLHAENLFQTEREEGVEADAIEDRSACDVEADRFRNFRRELWSERSFDPMPARHCLD